MSKLTDRFQFEMDSRKINAYELSEKSGVSQPTIHRILSGKHGDPRSQTVEKLALALNVDEIYLRGLSDDVCENNTQNYNVNYNAIPLINWSDVGSIQQKEHTMIDFFTLLGPKSFALTVIGDSMLPEFSDGDIIAVDPSISPSTGDYVVAMVDNAYTFKQLCMDGANKLLKPLNERYPIRPLGDGEIVGVIVEKRKQYRNADFIGEERRKK